MTNIPPPIIVTKKIALGMFFCASIVSSDKVVTASKRRKDNAKIAAPENTVANEPSELKKGIVVMTSPAPLPASTPLIEKEINRTRKSVWNKIKKKLALVTTLIHLTLSKVTHKIAIIVQSHPGVDGNSAFK